VIQDELLHPDTQAVLLLCGVFSNRTHADKAKPLTPGEYNQLATWLKQQKARPAELLRNPLLIDSFGESLALERDRLQHLLNRGMQLATTVERWARLGIWVLSRSDADYPERLRRHLRSSAPPILYGVGDRKLLNAGGLAIVGSRNVEEEGLAFTRRVTEHCAADGVSVISGGARGVDQAAATGVLESGGNALVVLAERLDQAATAKAYKVPIRDGRLTLVCPYEPEATFTVGRAMGRNKSIYALADGALVVRFTTGEGGTWTGAMEQLKRNQQGGASVPITIRRNSNPQDGIDALTLLGALIFPEDVFWERPARQLFSSEATTTSPTNPPITPPERGPELPPTLPPATSPVPAATVAPSPIANGVHPEARETASESTCYTRCLPMILAALEDSPSLKILVERLELVEPQLKVWLERAITEGKVEKKKGKRGAIIYGIPSASLLQPQRNVDAA